jgi:hypothetical protein
MGVLSVVLGFAALPCSAMAQADTTPPTITIASPLADAQYTVGQAVTASYTCADNVAVASCVGNVANGAALDTSTAGQRTLTVTAIDTSGNQATESRTYNVVQDTGGQVPATLSLTLGAPATFSPFIPSIGRDYTASLGATILSTAENATLSVADQSATATGHLVNGSFALEQPVRAAGTSANPAATGTTAAPVGGSSAPTTLLTYNAPVSNDQATINFTQAIGASEALRTGSYAKTLTFTLSTTNP